MCEHTANIPGYFVSFTHEMVVLTDNDTDKHKAIFQGPMHKQHDFHALTTISSLSSSIAHTF